ncbi:MAG: isochorismatase family protein [Burkholderiales bacterium]|nr:isochorismatase family protein [Burkholderiales bacterium]
MFVAVSDAASMTGAARILGVSQAAVSQQIARLEQSLGLRLIERGARELRLTPAGAHLRHLGKRVLAELAQAERAMKRFQGYSVPHLTVGLMESMSEILSTTIVTALETQVQHLEVRSSLNFRYHDSLLDESLNIDGNEIVAEITPAAQDIVIHKQKPSGFFGTNMASYLQLLGADSVIVTGTTTSGCVRATVLDAFSLNFRVAVAEEGCFDRSQASHAINLCDMHAKYADVVKTAEVLSFFETLPAGLFELPRGAAPAPAKAANY